MMFYDYATEKHAIHRGLLIQEKDYLSQITIQNIFKNVSESFGHSFLNNPLSKPLIKGLWRSCLNNAGLVFNDSILEDHIDFVSIKYTPSFDTTKIKDPKRRELVNDFLNPNYNIFAQ